jgi:molybdopterin-containing oxidoreductase family iron-sulfur binding subunit
MPPLEPKKYWRSLEERDAAARSDGNEFPPGASEMDGATRRDFLKLLGGTAVLAGAAGCRNPPETVMPYAKQPAEIVPGDPLHYATTLTRDGYGLGVIVAAREGRPIKIEGNPDHPASLGATTAIEQAQVWHLYDPQRARTLRHEGKPKAWAALVAALAERAQKLAADGGAGLRFLVEPSSSPVEAWLRQQILAKFPKARFYGWSPTGAGYAGTQLAFGKALETRYDFDRARVIVSLDADFLSEGPFCVRYARQFADHRVPQNQLNRLYTVEAGFSSTGAAADHRLRCKPSEVIDVAVALANLVKPGSVPPERAGRFAQDKLVQVMARDLKAGGATALVVAGPRQPPAVQAIAAVINAALGSQCVGYSDPILPDSSGIDSLAALADEVKGGHVDTLVCTAWNPVYSAPADVDVAAMLRGCNSIYRSLFDDETAPNAAWFVPATHQLEEWGDARAVDGTVSLRQPLIHPLFAGLSTIDLYAAVLGSAARGPLRLLRDYWRTQHTGADFEHWWSRTVQNGVVEGTAVAAQPMTPTGDLGGPIASAPRASSGLELSFLVDGKVHDGRYGDNAWLQELPEPLTKVTWGNAVLLGPATAKNLGVAVEDVVELTVAGKSLRAPAFVLPGLADDVAQIAIGYGRQGAEMIAREIGANAGPLRTRASWWLAHGAQLRATGEKRKLAKTHDHWSTEGRPIALEVDADELESKKKTVHLELLEESKESFSSMYPSVEYDGFRWAMAIDMSRCSGCNACVMACASENNTLIVGPDQVARGREMHWLRIDRYFSGDENAPEATMQPVACVHCENAPCEYVCPVNATVHSDEGLNEMVYNRCVGTRYCSNNCPYKVRRFNYFNYHDRLQGTEEMAMNPDVTVRARGVMEKCTYCVQRIERYRIDTRNVGKTHRDWKDGDVVTACAQACPSNAIVFGTLSDEKSRVAKLHGDERAYKLLDELNTKPRTVHLARVRNKNPELA